MTDEIPKADPTDGAPETDHIVNANKMINKDLIRELKHHAQEWSGRIVGDRLTEAAEALTTSDARIAELEGDSEKITATRKLITWASKLIEQFPDHGGCSAWMSHYTGNVVLKDYGFEEELDTARNEFLDELIEDHSYKMGSNDPSVRNWLRSFKTHERANDE